MDSSGDVKNINQTMTRRMCVGTAQCLSTLMHGRPIHRRGREEAGIEIDLKVIEHLLPFCLQKAFGPVIEV